MKDKKEINESYRKCSYKIITGYVPYIGKWRCRTSINYTESINPLKSISKLFENREDAESYCRNYCKTMIDKKLG